MFHNRSRVKAFTGPRAEERAERVGNWLKALMGQDAAKAWCIDHGIALTKAANETTNSVGGFLAPTDFDAAVAIVVETMGVWRLGAETRPARSGGQVRPRRSGGLTANL